MGTDNEGGHCQPVIHVETSGATQHSTVNDWHGMKLFYNKNFDLSLQIYM